MNNNGGILKIGLRFGLLATIVFACNLATVDLPTLQSVRNTVHPILQSARNSIHSILNFTSTAETPAMQDIPAITPMDVVQEMLGQVSKDRALVDLRKLTGGEPICTDKGCYTIANRLTGSEGLQWAKDYIYEELVSLGYSVEAQDWSHSGYADQNIIARKPGLISPGEEIYFIAHIDGKGDEGDRYPAADDDASGVVDILELARVLSNYTFSRTVVLFFSTGEEESRLGVKSYLGQISPKELSSIKYAVDIDMVGYDGNHDSGMELWYGGQSSSLALTQIISETIKAYQIGLEPTFIVGCG